MLLVKLELILQPQKQETKMNLDRCLLTKKEQESRDIVVREN